ncbi:DNA replication/repair protein RecF [Rhizosphaericola mali]|uniref:DNA replication and repair protein RecF n=1 Tax=Rhizosphaericola mali TaxID=2545455 RepID=A0A5P2G744_9BACT|nr:DNA replication and repair protein RecF [Rhizosphaericola mali]QES90089.1 DNA replication and repair protein RecF [Rhizosphaericola mali]
MLGLSHIRLFQFRNYAQNNFDFKQRIVAITGKNGSGKTNLLDAIYMLCFTKSYFSKPDPLSVLKDHVGFRIDGNFQSKGDDWSISLILRENNKKELTVNKETYKKFSAHLGKFPCVMVAPDDIELIIGSSENRRKFLDTLLSQLDSDYLLYLIQYNQILTQRNSLLKSAPKGQSPDPQLLDTYDELLAPLGMKIFEIRKTFLEHFGKSVLTQYQILAESDDFVNVFYQSKLSEQDYLYILKETRQKDILLQRTTAGVHRDDLIFNMGEVLFKSQASQGQKKSLLFALKLAEFKELKSTHGAAPILLLDDIFEKLDAARMQNLLKNACIENEGNVFITDTHAERIDEAMIGLNIPYQLITL